MLAESRQAGAIRGSYNELTMTTPNLGSRLARAAIVGGFGGIGGVAWLAMVRSYPVADNLLILIGSGLLAFGVGAVGGVIAEIVLSYTRMKTWQRMCLSFVVGAAAVVIGLVLLAICVAFFVRVH
jgi:hypothetical protein